LIRSASTLAAAALALVAAAPAARADDLAEARRHFEAGEAHYARGAWREAFASYEAAYRSAPLPDLLFNLGQCQRKLGDRERALELYRRFLESSPPQDKRHIVEELLRDLEAEPAPDAPVAEPPPAGPPREPGPGAAPPPREPGPGAAPPPPAPAQPGLVGWLRAPTWVLGVAGLATLATAGALAYLAQGGQQELDDLDCEVRMTECLEVRDDTEPLFLAQNVSVVAGAVLLATAVVLAILDASATPQPDVGEVAVAPALRPGGLGLMGAVRW
jgi:tetratricopeptide (TPR) repeat protein